MYYVCGKSPFVCVCVCVQIEVSSRCVHARERIKEPVMICEIKFNTSCVYNIHILYGPIYSITYENYNVTMKSKRYQIN